MASGSLSTAVPPAQPPVAETLRAQGRVQVYINFDTDRTSLQPSAEPVLRGLLTALNSRPALPVDLIGPPASRFCYGL